MSLVLRVRPAHGRIVPQPEKGYAPMPAEGTTVAIDVYYSAALRFGDIEEIEEETKIEASLPLFEKPIERSTKPASKVASAETDK